MARVMYKVYVGRGDSIYNSMVYEKCKAVCDALADYNDASGLKGWHYHVTEVTTEIVGRFENGYTEQITKKRVYERNGRC